MGNFKAFLLGLFTAYGIYFITRKGADGHSILEELLSDPESFMDKTKDYVMKETIHVIKEGLS